MLILFYTEGCHLCDLALDIVQAGKPEVVALHLCDVATDAALVERYGLRIPVVDFNGVTLGWPFTLSEFQHWLLPLLSQPV